MAGMMKEFRFDTYNGKSVVICGPLYRSMPVFMEFLTHPEIELYFCYDSNGKYSWEILLRAFFSKVRPELAVRFKQLYGKLYELDVTVINTEALAEHREDYLILTGSTSYQTYLEVTGYRDLSGFYSPVAIMQDAFKKGAYAESFFQFLYEQSEKTYLAGLEIMLTTRCSLQCRDCANLIPYHHEEQIRNEQVLAGIKRLFDTIDGIGMLKLLGGEPLLAQPLLIDIVKLLQKEHYKKALVVRIITNGTVLFQKETLKTLSKYPLVTVYISDYGKHSTKIDLLMEQMDAWKIPYVRNGDNLIWQDFGHPLETYGSQEEVELRYRECHLKEKCLTLLNGSLYHCPRAANGEALGFYGENPCEKINLLEENMIPDELKKKIHAWYHENDAICACRFCKSGSGEKIPKAIQL